jgi:hypothetical protein
MRGSGSEWFFGFDNPFLVRSAVGQQHKPWVLDSRLLETGAVFDDAVQLRILNAYSIL